VLREEEIGQAYQFGNESTVRNVLEPNWWESDEHTAQAQMIADEALRLDTERRGRDEPEEQTPVKIEVEDKPKVVARTRVRSATTRLTEAAIQARRGIAVQVVGTSST
jgi:ATP-dependent DNA helicase 2 subunit 1